MNPLAPITRPVRHLWRAITLPFTALFVIGLTAFINGMTYSGQWWFKWVALGMGIAVLVAWARAAKTLVLLAVVWFVGRAIDRRWGGPARAQFDDWVRRARPQAAEVIDLFRSPERRAQMARGR